MVMLSEASRAASGGDSRHSEKSPSFLISWRCAREGIRALSRSFDTDITLHVIPLPNICDKPHTHGVTLYQQPSYTRGLAFIESLCDNVNCAEEQASVAITVFTTSA